MGVLHHSMYFLLAPGDLESRVDVPAQVNIAQHRYPDLLGPSIAAWQSAESARNSSDPKVQSRDEADQLQTSKKGSSIGRLLSRFYDPEKRKVKAKDEDQGGNPKTDTHRPNKNGKIQALLKGCISGKPISK